MRFTLSALSLAEATARDFSYAWPKTNLFRPALTDLWEFGAREIPWADAVELSKEVPYAAKFENLPENADFQPIWHFRSGDPLPLPGGAPTWTDRFRGLTPTPGIQARVTGLHTEHLKGDPYVGVMIRAHEKSHHKTLEASPIDWYLERMSGINDANPRTKFFISCDVPTVQERLMHTFPNSVGQSNKGLYNSTEGVISGVVDLYLLAASSHMIVPYWSSFPDMAWELADRKIVMENSRNGRWSGKLADVPLASDPLRPGDRS